MVSHEHLQQMSELGEMVCPVANSKRLKSTSVGETDSGRRLGTAVIPREQKGSHAQEAMMRPGLHRHLRLAEIVSARFPRAATSQKHEQMLQLHREQVPVLSTVSVWKMW
jgi:hypothetical protein